MVASGGQCDETLTRRHSTAVSSRVRTSRDHLTLNSGRRTKGELSRHMASSTINRELSDHQQRLGQRSHVSLTL